MNRHYLNLELDNSMCQMLNIDGNAYEQWTYLLLEQACQTSAAVHNEWSILYTPEKWSSIHSPLSLT